MRIQEWTITRLSTSSIRLYIIAQLGHIVGGDYNESFYVRPTFYLKPEVNYAGGTGTPADPYRIS